MNPFLAYLLIGLGVGVPVFFIFLGIYKLIKNTMERRMVKRQIKAGKFLVPIDTRDYNVEAWKNHIDVSKTAEDLNRLNQKIFKKAEHSDMLKNFVLKAREYTTKAKANGKTEEEIKAEMKDNQYSDEMINKIFGDKPLW
jgi:DNA-binding transcriptional regulator YhcF (GntR family)